MKGIKHECGFMKRAEGFVARSSFQPFTCTSPSTDSTTSLLQLRDKFQDSVLFPLILNKVPGKIATAPEFPILNVLDEHENLSNSLPKTKRCGVSLKYNSDSQAQKRRPVFEEHSASLSITNELFKKLYEDNPNFDLSACLVMEDCGNISDKLTQDGDVVANTPVEKEVRHKQLSIKRNAKSIAQDEPAFDESEVEVIEDPRCYVYDKKERVRTNNTKADQIISEEMVTLDETTIDAFVCKDMNQNNTENIIGPTLVKNINKTSLQASNKDCIIVEEREKERHIDNLRFAKNIDNNSNMSSAKFKRSNDKLKSDKDRSCEQSADGTKTFTLKLKQSTKIAPKVNTREKATNYNKGPIDIGKSNVLVERISSPINPIKATLTRKKRKLYSAKDDENEDEKMSTPKTRVERRQLNVNQTPIATCYRELENTRQSHSRISRKSRASSQTKKSKKSRYSTYSDSEDPSFQIRKYLSSSSIGSTTTMMSTMSRRDRPVRPVNYINEHYCTMHSFSEDDHFEHNRTIKPKTGRKIIPRSRKVENTSRTTTVLSPQSKKKNEVLEPTEIKKTALVSDVLSERSIANKLTIQTNKPAASQTSSVIPITRISTPKIVLERISSDEIDRWLRKHNPDNVCIKKISLQVMETLQTTLAEIHQATGERLTAAFLKEIHNLKKKVQEIDLGLAAMQRVNLREQEMAPTHDSRQPPTSVGSQDSRARAHKPVRRASTDAEMNQGFRDPCSCTMSSGNPSKSRQEARVAVHRRIRSGFVARSSFQPFTCTSSSTDSTTSLLQLRDKLTVLSPLLFNKLPHKIATSPELPVLNELDEQNLNNSLSKTKRCGVLKYHSDSEAQAQITKKSRCLSPVVEEHSASLILRAALGNADDLVTNDVFERLYKENPNFDLADLLVVEALQHGQEKDSGIISGKVTQDSDVVENTPLEKQVRPKQLSIKRNAKSIAQDEPALDESEVEVIEDTPCYVYDRKERVRTNNKKADKIISEEIITLNETAIDAFFFQHVDQNNTENVISPTFAKKINETSSDASDDDCIIVGDHFMGEELSVKNLAIDADILDCVNSVIDKVCNDLDEYAELLAEQERHIDNLRSPKNIEDNSNIGSDMFKKSTDKFKSNKDTSHEHNTKGTKKVTLKFKQSKKVATKMNTTKKAAKKDKDPIDIGKNNVLVESTNTSSPLNSTTLTRKKRKLYSPKDDENENKEITTPKTRVERRLSNVNQTKIATCYKDLENARQSHSRVSQKSIASFQAKESKKSRYNMSSESGGEDQSFQIRKRISSSSIESTTTMSRRKRSMKIVNYNDEYNSTMYSSSDDSDFKHNRTLKPKTARKIKPKSPKVAKTTRTQPILSPKTKKLNEMFDKIKDNVVNDEKITLVEKKSVEKDLSLYNLSSESEDGDFKKKKNEVKKRISASSLESSATKRRRLMSRVNYSKYYSSEDEDKRTQKSKTLKQAKPRSRKTNKIPKFNLIDERMRAAQQETLETSFVKDTVNTNNRDEPEPALQQAHVLEDLPPDKSNDDETEAVLLENKTESPKKLAISKLKKETKLSKTCEKVTRSIATKKSKEITKIVSKEKDSAPVSPLPGLVVETEKTRQDDLTSSIEANLLQKFKKIYTDVPDLNQTDDTRHLLLNADENDDAVLEPTEIIETALVSDELSERSIATGGRSPITGHNDLNESPPNVELLDEDFQHRDLHNEGMSESMAEFLTNMRNHLQTYKPTASLTSPVIPITRISTKESARSNPCAEKMLSEESNNKSNKSNPKVVLERIPTVESESKLDANGTPKSKVSSVVLTRISSEEIEKYMSPTHTKKTSDTESPKIVLERISSDEINRWLPMPKSKNIADTGATPKKYITRQTSKLTETKIPTKRQTSKPAENKTPVIERRSKTKISPVKLSFDIVELTMSAEERARALRTRSSTKSIKSSAPKPQTIKNDQSFIKNSQETSKLDLTMSADERARALRTRSSTKSIKSSAPKAQTSKNDLSFIKNSQETSKSSVTRSIRDKAVTSVDRSDVNKSIASVQDWLTRNAAPSSASAADNYTYKEMLCQMMETLDTTLAEIDQATGERFTAAFLKNRDEMTCLEKDFCNRIAELNKKQMNRVCEVLRADVEMKAGMVKFLKETIQSVLNQHQ